MFLKLYKKFPINRKKLEYIFKNTNFILCKVINDKHSLNIT